MQNIRFFPTLVQYRDFIRHEVVINDDFLAHPFYSRLVDFIIDLRTPIFFDQSSEVERAHFSQYFNYVPTRSYENSYIKDLYYLHDFVHMLFDYPLKPRRENIHLFYQRLKDYEFYASQATEVLVYYDLPQLREKTLKKPILFDLLIKKHPQRPDIHFLYDLIQKITFNDEPTIRKYFNLEDPADLHTLNYYQMFAKDNEVWKESWYYGFPEIVPDFYNKISSDPHNYESFIGKYSSQLNEEGYRRNILYNTRLGLKLLGIKDLPQTFLDCPEYLSKMEGEIIMKEAAEAFHKVYQVRQAANPVG